MSTSLPQSAMQGLPDELAAFLSNMHAQFTELQLAPSARRVAASTRMFVLPSGPTGYKYVYIPRSRRLTHREVRQSLKTLGVESSRLLDITFPARGVVGILVHSNDFDPLDPSHIADPKYAGCQFMTCSYCCQLHHNRCLHALKYLRPHLLSQLPTFSVMKGGLLLKMSPPCCSWFWLAGQLLKRSHSGSKLGFSLLLSFHFLVSNPPLWFSSCWLLRGSMGVSVLISPSCPYPVTQVPMPSKYALAVKIGSLRVICLYLPPTMSHLMLLSFCDYAQSVVLPYANGLKSASFMLSMVTWPFYPHYLSFRLNVEISSIVDLFLTNMTLQNASLISTLTSPLTLTTAYYASPSLCF
ncbi:hypothetical protein CLU79DRAFT_892656 [Phycomyces nitens]|nr:hypothetical protein CLU79DRAFT_892656 [Phycomyces nitens]